MFNLAQELIKYTEGYLGKCPYDGSSFEELIERRYDGFPERVERLKDWLVENPTAAVIELSYYFPFKEIAALDLNRVEFDCENLEVDSNGYDGMAYGPLLGFNVLANGKAYLGVMAGGDWEFPVFFIIYWDESQQRLRGYLPPNSVYNKLANSAFGNHDDMEWDFKKDSPTYRQEVPTNVGKSDKEALIQQYSKQYESEDDIHCDKTIIDCDAILNDIQKFFGVI